MRRKEIITRDPDILGGTPVFTGTRVPIDSLLAHLKGGANLAEFLGDFPSVRREQVEAVLALMEDILLSENDAHSP